MPHKHTRRKGAGDNGSFNLAPSVKAKPLPTLSNAAKNKHKQDDAQRRKLKRKRTGTGPGTATGEYGEDDTPRAFARLLRFHTTKQRPTSLDDGERKGKKPRNPTQQDADSHPTPLPSASAPDKVDIPRILPGERLADYNARVDQALPMGNLTRKRVKVDGAQERQTKTEKRLKKMYAAWREEEARRRERREELQEREEAAEEEQEAEFGGGGQRVTLMPEGRKGRRKRMVGEPDGDDGDPWEVLKERREAPGGLHDVVQAPPTFTTVPREKFKVRNGAAVDVANVPVAAGSLSRREELGDARRDVIERYRAMMKSGRS